MAVRTGAFRAQREHLVTFYSDDQELAREVAGFLRSGRYDESAAIVVATPAHWDAIAANLDDAERARVSYLDAADTLARLMVDGHVDDAAFDAVVGTLVRRTVAAHKEVRAFGEMVGLLWEAGDVACAVQLEGLWNGLQERQQFSLLCAYPKARDRAAALPDICDLHGGVVTEAPTPVDADLSRWFWKSPESPRYARQFVAQAVETWGMSHIAAECQLVVSELATNAVRHSASDFTVSLLRLHDGVVIVVGDADPTPPVPRQLDSTSQGGRGMHLIDGVSTMWGHRLLGDGKLVWANIVTCPEVDR